MNKVVLIISFFVVIYGCRKDKVVEVLVTSDLCADTISYAEQIQPFLDINCSTSGCHNAASSADGYVFESHEDAATNANIILSVIRHDPGLSAMPQSAPKLPDTTIQQMECWIEQGAMNN